LIGYRAAASSRGRFPFLCPHDRRTARDAGRRGCQARVLSESGNSPGHQTAPCVEIASGGANGCLIRCLLEIQWALNGCLQLIVGTSGTTVTATLAPMLGACGRRPPHVTARRPPAECSACGGWYGRRPSAGPTGKHEACTYLLKHSNSTL
jgi:hypothetical protein